MYFFQSVSRESGFQVVLEFSLPLCSYEKFEDVRISNKITVMNFDKITLDYKIILEL